MTQIRNWAALVALLAAIGIAPVAAADPLPIRIGWAQAPGHLAPLLDVLAQRHPEIMPHQGKSYAAQAVRFAGSTPQIQAVAVNELEIAAFAPSSLALAITNAHLDMRIVSDVEQDGLKGHYDEPYVVRKDGPIKTVDDVRGKRVATNAIGSASDNAMRIMLRQHGIQDKDFTTVEVNFANMVAMLDEDKVDMIGAMPQYLHQLDAAGKFRTLYTASDARGPAQTIAWAMRADFIKAHRPVLVDFFEDHIRGVRWFLDPKNRVEALAIAIEVTKQKPEDLAYAFTDEDFYRSPDCVPNIEAAQHEIDISAKLGLLPQAITLAPEYDDLSLIRDAKIRIDGK